MVSCPGGFGMIALIQRVSEASVPVDDTITSRLERGLRGDERDVRVRIMRSNGGSMRAAEAGRDAVRTVLSVAIERGGTTLRDYRNLEGEGSNQHHLKCYGRGGQLCFVCAATLRSRIIDARTTTWCPQCQAR